MIDRITEMLDILKSMKIPTSKIEQDLGYSNGLLKKGSLSIDKYNKLVAYFERFTQPCDEEFVFYVYKLIDPRTDEMFYIGHTRRSLKERLHGHIYYAIKERADAANQKIIRDIINEGFEPKIEAIEEFKGNCLIELFKKTTEAETNLTLKFMPKGNSLDVLKKNHNDFAVHTKKERKQIEDNMLKDDGRSKELVLKFKSQIVAQSAIILELETENKALKEQIVILSQNKPLEGNVRKTDDVPKKQQKNASAVKIQDLTNQAKTNYSIDTADSGKVGKQRSAFMSDAIKKKLGL